MDNLAMLEALARHERTMAAFVDELRQLRTGWTLCELRWIICRRSKRCRRYAGAAS